MPYSFLVFLSPFMPAFYFYKRDKKNRNNAHCHCKTGKSSSTKACITFILCTRNITTEG